jgi:hypothetical protein
MKRHSPSKTPFSSTTVYGGKVYAIVCRAGMPSNKTSGTNLLT